MPQHSAGSMLKQAARIQREARRLYDVEEPAAIHVFEDDEVRRRSLLSLLNAQDGVRLFVHGSASEIDNCGNHAPIIWASGLYVVELIDDLERLCRNLCATVLVGLTPQMPPLMLELLFRSGVRFMAPADELLHAATGLVLAHCAVRKTVLAAAYRDHCATEITHSLSIQACRDVGFSPPLAEVSTIASLERGAVVVALRQSDGCKARAARALGISRRTLYRKLLEFEI